MTDTEKRIAEIREALDAATPGPWENVRLFYVGVTTEGRFYPVAECDDQNNAILIANAPEWLRFLLDELEKITEQRDAYYNNARYTEAAFHEVTSLRSQLQSAQQEIKRLEQERDKLIECLRFYERLARGREINDGGRRARTLLAEIGVTVE